MNHDYLQRYRSGACVAVERELAALGAAVMEEPVGSEARAVMRELMERVRHNIILLIEGLQRLDYRFAGEPRRPPDGRLAAQVAALERTYGPLPLSLSTWYAVIGEVDLRGAHPRLSMCRVLAPENLQGPLSDPLVVACMTTIDEIADFIEDTGEPPPYVVEFAPDANHKGRFSGGANLAIALGQSVFDGAIIGGLWDGMPFLSYLRLCFQWAGFPGFEHAPRDAATAQHELATLAHGLLAF